MNVFIGCFFKMNICQTHVKFESIFNEQVELFSTLRQTLKTVLIRLSQNSSMSREQAHKLFKPEFGWVPQNTKWYQYQPYNFTVFNFSGQPMVGAKSLAISTFFFARPASATRSRGHATATIISDFYHYLFFSQDKKIIVFKPKTSQFSMKNFRLRRSPLRKHYRATIIIKLSSEPHNFQAFSYLFKIPKNLHKVKNFNLKPPVLAKVMRFAMVKSLDLDRDLNKKIIKVHKIARGA